MKILTLTMNPTIDINSRVDQVVAEKKLRCEQPDYEPGGGGINVSRAIRKLGGKSEAMYLSGGANGNLLGQLLDKEEITQSQVAIGKLTRENFHIRETSGSQQFRFAMPGPEVEEEEWESCLEQVRSKNPKPEFIVASGSLPPGVPDDFYARLAKQCKDAGIHFILDTAGKSLRIAFEQGVFLIKPNMREIQDIIDKEIENEYQLKEIAGTLLNKANSEVIVISLGAGGALVITKDDCSHLRSPTVPIKSKVGAGDSMTAGIVLALSRSNKLIDAVKFGVAAGAAAVMTPGTELCRREDAERIYNQMD
ncbi:hexose kinase [candidate division KSB1 bacterium]|nr:hexose kinase [candidate division KSB1 bacterium]